MSIDMGIIVPSKPITKSKLDKLASEEGWLIHLLDEDADELLQGKDLLKTTCVYGFYKEDDGADLFKKCKTYEDLKELMEEYEVEGHCDLDVTSKSKKTEYSISCTTSGSDVSEGLYNALMSLTGAEEVEY